MRAMAASIFFLLLRANSSILDEPPVSTVPRLSGLRVVGGVESEMGAAERSLWWYVGWMRPRFCFSARAHSRVMPKPLAYWSVMVRITMSVKLSSL